MKKRLRPDLPRATLEREVRELEPSVPDARRAVAGQYGFPSWDELVSCLELLRDERPGPAEFRRLIRVQATRKVLGAHRRIVESFEAAEPFVIEGLADADPRVRRTCAKLLDRDVGASALEALAPLLRDPVERVRKEAVHSLSCGHCKTQPTGIDAIALLMECALHDSSLKARGGAAYGFWHHPPDQRAARTLLHILHEDSDSRLLSLARFVFKRHSRALPVPELIELLRDDSRAVREGAIRGLWHRGATDEAEPALRELMRADPEPALRHQAARALGERLAA